MSTFLTRDVSDTSNKFWRIDQLPVSAPEKDTGTMIVDVTVGTLFIRGVYDGVKGTSNTQVIKRHFWERSRQHVLKIW